MRISERFNLSISQSLLEFVDVDLDRDAPFFIDPRALHDLDSEWAEECVALVQDFFREVLSKISSGNDERAKSLLRILREPNETHLGLSRAQPRGHGLGDNSSVKVWEALSESEAVRSGLLEDLEDTILMIPGISNDIVSDITTNIIRRPLIEFTRESCQYHGIPMTPGVSSGALWNPLSHGWETRFVELPIVESRKLLLVPKSIVRKRLEYSPEDYYNNFILEALREIELNANSALVELLKSGDKRVTKTSLKKKYGTGKAVITRLTREHPEVLDKYRAAKRDNPARCLSNETLVQGDVTRLPDWEVLLSAVLEIEPGRAGADAYHRAVESLFQALFYPSLVNPIRESRIHEGRKRIDIKFTNAASTGFFWRINTHHRVPAGYIVIECKNYSEDISNPELDQLVGRFSPTRGRLGLLVFRHADNSDVCVERCRDAFHDDRGWILPLDDDDLKNLVEERKLNPNSSTYQLLEDRFAEVVS
ncbi:MAG: hypothetical protein M0T78_12355 [Actinomycetota bacterium]|nr:hypothetical protein [Actinomycetota bacterium]